MEIGEYIVVFLASDDVLTDIRNMMNNYDISWNAG